MSDPNSDLYEFLHGAGRKWQMAAGQTLYPDNRIFAELAHSHRFDGALPIKLTTDKDNAAISVSLADGGALAKSEVRFLPFRENEVTYMKIDEHASIFTTSGLSGCNIYVCTITDGAQKGTWVFHANSNDNKDDAKANNASKEGLALTVRNVLGGGAWDLKLERHAVAYYKKCGGIFFAQKVVKDIKSPWGFYYYDLFSGKVHTMASSQPHTNRTLAFA